MDTARLSAHSAPESNPAHPVLPPAEWGRVVLVGAGPGDAELLTLKAARMLASARVVLYDNLVSEDVLRLIPQDAERIYVGKRSSNHTLPQEGIIELMVRLAKAGKSLVRLKGSPSRGMRERMGMPLTCFSLRSSIRPAMTIVLKSRKIFDIFCALNVILST